jgi:hypothetical protein
LHPRTGLLGELFLVIPQLSDFVRNLSNSCLSFAVGRSPRLGGRAVVLSCSSSAFTAADWAWSRAGHFVRQFRFEKKRKIACQNPGAEPGYTDLYSSFASFRKWSKFRGLFKRRPAKSASPPCRILGTPFQPAIRPVRRRQRSFQREFLGATTAPVASEIVGGDSALDRAICRPNGISTSRGGVAPRVSLKARADEAISRHRTDLQLHRKHIQLRRKIASPPDENITHARRDFGLTEAQVALLLRGCGLNCHFARVIRCGITGGSSRCDAGTVMGNLLSGTPLFCSASVQHLFARRTSTRRRM